MERCTTPNFSLITSHCVPLPLAGAPDMMSLGEAEGSEESAAASSRTLFVDLVAVDEPIPMWFVERLLCNVSVLWFRVTPHKGVETTGWLGAT